MRDFLKKHWKNLVFGIFFLLLIIPQTRMPIQVFIQRLIAFSPSETSKEDRAILEDYQWPLVDMDSQEINFAQSEGKVTIVNFWATWCPPCVAEMPSFQKLYDEYGGEVDFYFVTAEKPDKVERFLKKHEYALPVYLQYFEAPEQLQSSVLPTTYLISKNGEIIINESGAADWNSKKIKKMIDALLVE